MPASVPDFPTRLSTARVGTLERIADVWRSRELLVAFTRTELKVKYKNSVLGFMWSMLNPALYLVVFYVVFQLILGSGIPNFPIFLLSGLLVWNLFSVGTSGATGSVVANAGLVRKVSFAREVLPIAAVGAALVHFFLQAIVLGAALVIFRYDVSVPYLPLLPVALAALLLFAVALGIWLAALNVKLRDTAHLLELALLAWFWFTPIVYPYEVVAEKLGSSIWIYNLNPVTWIVLTFQRAIYGVTDEPVRSASLSGARAPTTSILPQGVDQWWYLWRLGLIALLSLGLLALGIRFFGRAEGDFAEEL